LKIEYWGEIRSSFTIESSGASYHASRITYPGGGGELACILLNRYVGDATLSREATARQEGRE
jgi:hypothetical protein